VTEAPIVELERVSRAFIDGHERREVLKDVSFGVKAREMVALVGPSGCGKTTLLNIIGALDDTFEGEAKLLGRSLRALPDDERTVLRNQSVGFVFQAFHLLEHLTVIQNVEVPLWLLPERLSKAEEAKRAREALETVGLGDRLHGSVRPLSGGERQRVAIARAIVNRPRLLLADEPTGNLDRDTGRSIYALFDRIKNGDGCAVVVATHDTKLAESADRTIAIANGKICG
jgi:putative ABC transport system ATP-binding protein